MAISQDIIGGGNVDPSTGKVTPYKYGTGVATIIGTFTVDTLPAASAALVGLYARVTDLFGEKTDLVLCSNSGSSYYWQPVRPTYAKDFNTDQNATLYPLKTPSVLFLTGTMSASRTMTLSNINAWPGASFEIAMTATMGLFSLNLLGTGLGSGLGVLAGDRRRMFFTAGGMWKQFT